MHVLAVSSIEAYAPAETGAGKARLAVAPIVIAFVVLTGLASALHKDLTQGFDEVAHLSYVAHMQETHFAWPSLTGMRMLDPKTLQFTDAANYLNHPPMFYALLAALGPPVVGNPDAVFVLRAIDVVLVALGFAALIALGFAARLSRYALYAYVVPLVCVPVLIPLAGSVNNDTMAFLGGAVALLGCFRAIAGDRKVWLAVAFGGLVLAAWAKLTGLLLVGGMVTTAVAYLVWRGKLAARWMLALGLALAVAAAPYIVFLVQYGSAAPNTPAQIALIADGARAAGWSELPRKSFPDYAVYFVSSFIAEWMPSLAPRSALNYAMLAIPVGALACAGAGCAFALRRLRQRRETALDAVVLAGTLAMIATFAVHIGYSYQRHLATGWLMDAYPRYYLPLIAVVPLAGLCLLASVDNARARTGLIAFLIAGPIAFQILGAPLG